VDEEDGLWSVGFTTKIDATASLWAPLGVVLRILEQMSALNPEQPYYLFAPEAERSCARWCPVCGAVCWLAALPHPIPCAACRRYVLEEAWALLQDAQRHVEQLQAHAMRRLVEAAQRKAYAAERLRRLRGLDSEGAGSLCA
jgi:hypothetical protein